MHQRLLLYLGIELRWCRLDLKRTRGTKQIEGEVENVVLFNLY